MKKPEALRWHSRKIVLDCNDDGSVELHWFVQEGGWVKAEKWVRVGSGHTAISASTKNPATRLVAPKFAAACPGSVKDCVVIDLDVVDSMKGGPRLNSQLLALRTEKEGKPGDAAALFGAAFTDFHGLCQARAAKKAKFAALKVLANKK